MDNYMMNTFMKAVAKNMYTIDDNFLMIAKQFKKLSKATKHNSKLIVMTNLALFCFTGVLYIQDKQIRQLEKDVAQLKSGETNTEEVKAE